MNGEPEEAYAGLTTPRGQIVSATPDEQGMTPEMRTPEGDQEPPWWSWKLEDDDMEEQLTSEAARRLDLEMEQEEFGREERAELVRSKLETTNWCGRDVGTAKAALRAIVALILKHPSREVPLSEVNKDLRWKSCWWRDLGSLYSFVRRTGRDILCYRNAQLSLADPLISSDLAYFAP